MGGGGEHRQFIYDGFRVIAEYVNGTLDKKYIYGPGIDEPLAMIDIDGQSETWYYYHFNGLGSVIALSDENGDLVESYSYNVFGSPTIYDGDGEEISVSAIGNPYMFTGRRYEQETGLYYYRLRDYNPSLGRFMQNDPIGYAGGMNLYAYCSNNPTNWTDPLGLYGVSIRPLRPYVTPEDIIPNPCALAGLPPFPQYQSRDYYGDLTPEDVEEALDPIVTNSRVQGGAKAVGGAGAVVGRINRVFDGCGFTSWSQISGSKVQRFLAELRKGENGISAQSYNHYLTNLGAMPISTPLGTAWEVCWQLLGYIRSSAKRL